MHFSNNVETVIDIQCQLIFNVNSQQVLERDLAIFGFFIALGRSTKSFLSASGYDVIDDPIEGFIRYIF